MPSRFHKNRRSFHIAGIGITGTPLLKLTALYVMLLSSEMRITVSADFMGLAVHRNNID